MFLTKDCSERIVDQIHERVMSLGDKVLELRSELEAKLNFEHNGQDFEENCRNFTILREKLSEVTEIRSETYEQLFTILPIISESLGVIESYENKRPVPDEAPTINVLKGLVIQLGSALRTCQDILKSTEMTIIGINHNIYYSTNPALIKIALEEIEKVDAQFSAENQALDFLAYATDPVIIKASNLIDRLSQTDVSNETILETKDFLYEFSYNQKVTARILETFTGLKYIGLYEATLTLPRDDTTARKVEICELYTLEEDAHSRKELVKRFLSGLAANDIVEMPWAIVDPLALALMDDDEIRDFYSGRLQTKPNGGIFWQYLQNSTKKELLSLIKKDPKVLLRMAEHLVFALGLDNLKA